MTQNINHFQAPPARADLGVLRAGLWVLGRATFQGAVRYDHAWSYFPEQTIPSQRFFPTANTFEFTDGASYNDFAPRGGVAFDVFGNGKTSAKFNFGRYLEAAQNGGFFITNNPTNRLSTTSARTWTDNDRDYVVDCDLLSQAAQSPTTTGHRRLRRRQRQLRHTVVASTLDPTLQSGWGVRTGDRQVGRSAPARSDAEGVGGAEFISAAG